MIHYQTTLSIDFGEMGYRNSKQPFRVRLLGNELTELIKDAENAHRVYELMLIDRPGDIWSYVWVVIDEVPTRINDRYLQAWQDAKHQYSDDHPWPLNHIPFNLFDEFFFWGWDDTDPEDEAWLSHRDSTTMKAFADQLFAMVREAQANLGWNDDLLRHIIKTIRAGKHPYSYLDRRIANKQFEGQRNTPLYTPDFYKTLKGLLRDPEIVSVAYRDGRDYQVLRMMATEQRRRANLTGHEPGDALYLSTLANNKISNAAWNSEICLFEEGLAHGDLHIEGINESHKNLSELVNDGWKKPGRYILSAQDEGDFEGYAKESGEGWVLYRQVEMDTRRRCLERIADRRHESTPVLQFGNRGQTLFDFEKSLVFVGVSVNYSTRMALAPVIAEWQLKGSNPVFVVLGDAGPFELAGCRKLHQPTRYLEKHPSQVANDWFVDLLKTECPWIDVIIALDIPEWAAKVLSNLIKSKNDPWPAWIISNAHQDLLKPDLLLAGDLDQTINEYHQRAKTSIF